MTPPSTHDIEEYNEMSTGSGRLVPGDVCESCDENPATLIVTQQETTSLDGQWQTCTECLIDMIRDSVKDPQSYPELTDGYYVKRL